MRLIFVHLGDSDPDYMRANIEYLSEFFPGLIIDVVTSKNSMTPYENKQINYFQYEVSETTETMLSSLNIDSDYRGGFWRYSLERLIALVEHHKLFPDESMLHIESDVLLLQTFPFDAFQSIQKIAWSPFEKKRDVASIIYLPNLGQSSWLHEQIKKLLTENTAMDDMHLLSLISSSHEGKIMSLPVAPKPESVIHSTKCDLSDEDRKRNSEHASVFDGIFDAAAIGIWLTGTHPVNAFGVSRRFDTQLIYETNSFVDPSNIKFQYSRQDGLFWIEENNKVNVHSLHIHSKNLDFFSLTNSKVIEKCVLESRKGKITRDFSPMVLVLLLKDNWTRGTLLRFLSWLPGIRKVRNLRNEIRN